MKKAYLLILPCVLFCLSSCVNDDDKSSKTFLADISSAASFEKYLSYSYSYTEQGNNSTGFYVVITVNIASLDSSYYFENLHFTISGDKNFTKSYSVPTNGNLTVSCNSTSYSSRDDRAYFLMTLTAGKIKTVSGKVYRI